MIFRPNSEIQRFFLPKIRWSPKKKKKKERSSPKLRLIFRPISQIQTFEGGCFRMGGLFSIFYIKSASKAQKTCDFAYFASQWGGPAPPPRPPPPLATLLIIRYACQFKSPEIWCSLFFINSNLNYSLYFKIDLKTNHISLTPIQILTLSFKTTMGKEKKRLFLFFRSQHFSVK